MLGAWSAQLRAAQRIDALRVELAARSVRLEAQTLPRPTGSHCWSSPRRACAPPSTRLAGHTLRTNSEMFLRLAREALGRDQVVAQGALKEREAAIAQLVEPLRVALERTEAQVQSLERERRDAFASLRTQIESLAGGQPQLQRETRNLVTALRRPEVRGRWGELTLRRLVELAGTDRTLRLHRAAAGAGDEGALRPDLVVHMPEARDLVIDAKTPLDAYLAALEAPHGGRARGGAAQATPSRSRHGCANWPPRPTGRSSSAAPSSRCCSCRATSSCRAALAERPELLENALAQSIIIATPSTLMALLKAVAYGWRQSAVAKNAAMIRDLGQELYKRLGNFTGHLGRMGQRLAAAVDAYNAGGRFARTPGTAAGTAFH